MELKLQRALEDALLHLQGGRLRESEGICRQVLTQSPNCAAALNLLGIIAQQAGQLPSAIELLGRAIAADHTNASYQDNFGLVLAMQGKLEEAAAAHRRAIELRPDAADYHCNLGNVLHRMGKLDAAIDAYRRALAIKPEMPQTLTNLGVALHHLCRFEEAIAAHRSAIALRPGIADAHYNLGNVLRDDGQLDVAAAEYRTALALSPNDWEACNSLSGVLCYNGDHTGAAAAARAAIQLNPNYAEAYNSLAIALQAQGQPDAAIAACHTAIGINPGYAEAYNNLGNTLKDQARFDDAIAAFRQAMRLKPESAVIHSNLIYALHFHPGYDAPKLAAEAARWNTTHAAPLRKSRRPHTNVRDPERRLKIGYLSPDFCDHVVGRYLLPILRAHGRKSFEIYCYSGVVRADSTTGQFRACADHWRKTLGLSDETLAEMIRGDGIDILVDLSLHMAGNRLLVFARKPAPVQATYLAYCSTSGLETMDYRLTDPWLDPQDSEADCYIEQAVRLPESYWCYQPVAASPQVGPPPSAKTGHITYGCLNNFCKVTPAALAAWTRLLRAAPGARLLLHAPEGSHRARVRDLLRAEGVSPDRLGFIGKLSLEDYFSSYGQIDIALDPFPYAGGTTTCDALWMGVPVVSLAGKTPTARGGVSILSNIGLPELVAQTTDEYVRIAAGLARDLPRLAALRAGLRARMQASPLMDAPRLARNIEAAYRMMWQRWCVSGERR